MWTPESECPFFSNKTYFLTDKNFQKRFSKHLGSEFLGFRSKDRRKQECQWEDEEKKQKKEKKEKKEKEEKEEKKEKHFSPGCLSLLERNYRSLDKRKANRVFFYYNILVGRRKNWGSWLRLCTISNNGMLKELGQITQILFP